MNSDRVYSFFHSGSNTPFEHSKCRFGYNVNLDRDFTLHVSGMKLGMKSTFIMAEIQIVYKMESAIPVLKCISVKITENIR